MKRITRGLLFAVIALVLVVSSVFAAGHETIVDIAVEDGRFDTLVAAVVYTDLAEALVTAAEEMTKKGFATKQFHLKTKKPISATYVSDNFKVYELA